MTHNPLTIKSNFQSLKGTLKNQGLNIFASHYSRDQAGTQAIIGCIFFKIQKVSERELTVVLAFCSERNDKSWINWRGKLPQKHSKKRGVALKHVGDRVSSVEAELIAPQCKVEEIASFADIQISSNVLSFEGSQLRVFSASSTLSFEHSQLQAF